MNETQAAIYSGCLLGIAFYRGKMGWVSINQQDYASRGALDGPERPAESVTLEPGVVYYLAPSKDDKTALKTLAHLKSVCPLHGLTAAQVESAFVPQGRRQGSPLQSILTEAVTYNLATRHDDPATILAAGVAWVGRKAEREKAA